jgi:peptidyl-prolyl cis-trans isomerase B (cyclophilin B)
MVSARLGIFSRSLRHNEAMTAVLTRLILVPVLLLAAVVPLLHAQGAVPPAAAAPAPGPVLVFETVKGTFEIETYPSQAPKTVAHVVALVNKRFYNGLRVHRFVPNFVVQFGDPQTRDMTKKELWGTGGSGSAVGMAEISKVLKHTLGTVSMAHAGDATEVDSQMFIVIGPAAHLDGKYPIIGKVTTGLDVVRKLAIDDRIIRATVKGTT